MLIRGSYESVIQNVVFLSAMHTTIRGGREDMCIDVQNDQSKSIAVTTTQTPGHKVLHHLKRICVIYTPYP